jgi:hypothetical protein
MLNGTVPQTTPHLRQFKISAYQQRTYGWDYEWYTFRTVGNLENKQKRLAIMLFITLGSIVRNAKHLAILD